MQGDKDKGYSSQEDTRDNQENAAAQTPGMVIEAVLRKFRARAGCREDSFVRLLSPSLLSRMARHVYRNWERARREVESGQRIEMPDMMILVTEELRNFGRRREISEEYDRRNARENLVHCELEEQRRRERGDYLRSPRRRHSLSQSFEMDPTLNLDLVQPVRFRSSPDSPVSPATAAADFEGHRSYQRSEAVRFHRRSHSKSVDDDRAKEERRRLRQARKSLDSLEIGKSPKKSPNEEERRRLRQARKSLDSLEIGKKTPSEGSSGDVQQSPAREDTPESTGSSVQGAVGGASPEESSTTTTPSEDLSVNIEEPKPEDDMQSTGAKVKNPPEEERSKKIRRIVEGLSTRQLVNLRNQSISRMDALELIIELSASLDRLCRLINGTKTRTSSPREDVDDNTLQKFFDSLEIARSLEIANRVSEEQSSNEASPASPPPLPAVTETPLRDPRVDNV